MTTQQSKIVNQKSKILTAVGLGPGDPDLITMKGLKAIQSSQIIFVPRSIKGEQSLALRIAEPWLNRDHQQVAQAHDLEAVSDLAADDRRCLHLAELGTN